MAVIYDCVVANDGSVHVVHSIGDVPDDAGVIVFSAIHKADVVTQRVVAPVSSAWILTHQVARTIIVVRDVGLHDGIDDATIEVKAATIQARAFVIVRNAVSDGYSGCIPCPNSNGTIALPRHRPAVVVRNTPFDQALVDLTNDNPIATVVGQVFWVACIVVHGAIAERDIARPGLGEALITCDSSTAVTVADTRIQTDVSSAIDYQSAITESAGFYLV